LIKEETKKILAQIEEDVKEELDQVKENEQAFMKLQMEEQLYDNGIDLSLQQQIGFSENV
jgi:hypothetical protein